GAADVDTGHGTHVATAALGFGNASGVGRGTAPASGLVFQAVENYAIPSFVCNLFYGLTQGYYLVGIPGDLGDLFQEAYEAGARIHSDSWGSAAAGAYTADSESTDAFIWNHRDMAVVFSAGNSGVDADADGLVDPVSLGAPATAKNVITVGASENDRQSHWECDAALSYGECANQGGQNHVFTYGEAWPGSFPAAPLRDDSSAGNAEQMAAFSSRGPTTDGRIKPDVVAPGTWTLSGYSDLYQQQYDAELNPQNGAYQYDGWGYPADEAHKYMGGTSMAAPLVAGGAAVVRDFYQKALGHPASAALVKATLINSAVDLLDENNDGLLDNAFPIPNGHEGWGRVDLAAATDGTQQYSDETAPMSTGVTASYTFTVADAGYPFKATLAWTDYASTPTAAVHLVNDLDLTVIASDGTMYLGNAFARGWSAVGGTPDRINNVENVYVPSAPAGTWTVIVSGYNIPMGPQPFALVVDQGPQGGSPLPVLRASAIDATATEAGPTGGLIDIIRTGDTSSELTVYYTVSGTATAGVDYVTLTGTVTIPVGASEASVSVDALDDLTSEPAETVVLTLEPDSAYIVKSPGSATVTIESDDLPPDLVISAVAGPAWAAAGDAVSVTDTTRNQGSQSTPSSATGFYLSTNSTLDQSDIFLGRRVVSSLAAAASEAATTELLIPASTTAGTYYVVAKADWDGQVEETSESNNTRASSAVRVGPDLLVSALSAPSTAAAGGTVQVGDTTKNQGAGASAVSVTTFYLSANVSWDAGDVAIGSRTVPALAGGATDTSSTSLLIPASTTAGTYYILARADGGDAVPEVAEHNNVRASASVRIGADLLVLALTAPTTAGNGEAITVTDTTKNGGGADAPASTTEYYLSVDTVFDAASDVWIGSRSVPALAAGASHTASVALVVPSGTAIGTYYVLARADGPDVVVETSESNNVRASGAMKLG
ncbi:MAG: S8 family serine peptidase, partial [Acidobacteriota bacterium]|nr:S8 family serine peptidase [Acidobacteriota bacterium]